MTENKGKVLYLCDRRRCLNCGPECFHTTDITHAVNYESDGQGGFWEVRHADKRPESGS